MRTKVILVVGAALFLGAYAPLSSAEKDPDALQGKWRSTSSTHDGEKLDRSKEWTELVIDKARVTWEQNTLMLDEWVTSVVPFSYELDPSKDPKTIDLTWADGTKKGKKQLGIYRLEENELTICVGGIDGARPKEFKSEKGSGHQLITLKRVKK